jgi:hypothetical protein
MHSDFCTISIVILPLPASREGEVSNVFHQTPAKHGLQDGLAPAAGGGGRSRWNGQTPAVCGEDEEEERETEKNERVITSSSIA